MSNNLDQDQDLYFVRPDLGPTIGKDNQQLRPACEEVRISPVKSDGVHIFIKTMKLSSCDTADSINTFFTVTTKASVLKVGTCTTILAGVSRTPVLG